MSVQTHQNAVTRAMKELANFEKKLADETKKEVSKSKDIVRIERSITKSTSLSQLHSKQQQLLRLANDISRIKSKQAELSKKNGDKTAQLHKYREALSKAEERERKKILDAEKHREREQLRHQKAITRELAQQSNLKQRFESDSKFSKELPKQSYDAFISHASEDKEEFVRPLAEALIKAGHKIWYDEFALKVGDSLRRSIDRGLVNSRYGIVVLSSFFFKKNWPQYELDGLVAKENDGRKVILPIWHKVSKDEVRSYSPTLSDKVAINSSISSLSEIVNLLGEVINTE